MPTRSLTVGERLARIEGRFDESDANARELWRKNDDALKGLAGLPERLARERGEDRGQSDGRLNAIVKEIERSVLTAIKDAIAPIKADMVELRTDVDALKALSNKLTGARLLLIFVMNMLAGLAAGFGGASWFSRGHP